MVEVAEPLLKPGALTAKLLKAIVKPTDGGTSDGAAAGYRRRTPRGASDLVRYLWTEVQGSDPAESLRLFGDEIVYEDFNFETPFVGRAAVEAFLAEFEIPGLRFVPTRISEGERAAAFTWRLEIGGVEGRQIRGISFYELGSNGSVQFVRDIPEPAIRPAPLAALAAVVRPGLRKF
jgi:hypothetical protein